MERISISMIISVLPSSTIGLDRGCYWTTLDIVSVFTLKKIQGVVLFDLYQDYIEYYSFLSYHTSTVKLVV
jgi:hypothetical protein